MTWEELTRISQTWGYTLDVMVRPNGFTEAGLIWDQVVFSKHGYGSEQAAIHDLLSMMSQQVGVVVKNIENGL